MPVYTPRGDNFNASNPTMYGGVFLNIENPMSNIEGTVSTFYIRHSLFDGGRSRAGKNGAPLQAGLMREIDDGLSERRCWRINTPRFDPVEESDLGVGSHRPERTGMEPSHSRCAPVFVIVRQRI